MFLLYLLTAKAEEERAARRLLITGNSGVPSFHSAGARVANVLLASFELGTHQLGWGFVQGAWESEDRRAAVISSPAPKSNRAI